MYLFWWSLLGVVYGWYGAPRSAGALRVAVPVALRWRAAQMCWTSMVRSLVTSHPCRASDGPVGSTAAAPEAEAAGARAAGRHLLQWRWVFDEHGSWDAKLCVPGATGIYDQLCYSCFLCKCFTRKGRSHRTSMSPKHCGDPSPRKSGTKFEGKYRNPCKDLKLCGGRGGWREALFARNVYGGCL